MSTQYRREFPPDFLWGTASSAYQCEGGNTNNQWYRWEQQGRILTGEHIGIADNWWNVAEKDFRFAEQMENNALRLGVEWSRIEPMEGRWDTAAIDRYRTMLQDLRKRHIRPIVTLHHFTDPLWFTARGGFREERNIRFFTRYVDYVVRQLGDLCDFWLTINEPNIYAILGYQQGYFPPGQQNTLLAMQVLRNLLAAHVTAFYAIRHIQPEAQIGYCLHYHLFDPANSLSPLDRSVAAVQNLGLNWGPLEALETGRFPAPLRALLTPIAGAAGARDYHGINYYTREMVRFDPSQSQNFFGHRYVKAGTPRNDPGMGQDFGEIYPAGLYRVLHAVYRRTRGNKPFYITENGFADTIENRRPRAILEHLAMVHRAIEAGIPIKGYFHWSLVDNFEWNEGWSVRFGLIEVDPLTQQRIPRRSASMFGEICRSNAITAEIVERYEPEAMESIFGSDRPRSQWRISV